MASQFFTVSQAADQLNISPSGVRRLCAEYGSQLSPSLQTAAGQARRLTAVDVEILREVISLKSSGLSPAAIVAKIEETVFSAPIIESPQTAQEAFSTAIMPLMVESFITATQAAIAPLQAQVDDLRKERRDNWVMYAYGIITAALFFLIILLLAWLV